MNRQIKEHREEIDWLYDDVGTLMSKLAEIQAKHSTALSLSIEEVWTGHEDCHDELVWTAPETDEEQAARIADEQQEAEELKAKSRRLAASRAKGERIKELEKQLKKERGY